MKKLGAAVAAFGVLAALVGVQAGGADQFILAAAALLCGYTTARSERISTFLKIFVAIFSTETILAGLVRLLEVENFWPQSLADYTPAESMALTVAVFSILVFAISHIPVVRQMTRIADLYFDSEARGDARLWPLPRFTARERSVAFAMIVALVLINQAQVGITVRLSFFNRDWFNAIQEKNSAEFWRQLLLVFTPWAFVYVSSGVVEFVVQSLLVIRWRRWLTQHYVSRWLDGHAHYRMMLAGHDADNPDQRISEDVNRFINGGTEGYGYGVYSYSILLISTLSSLVSFAIVLWDLSGNYPIPGTSVHIPGFLFWVAVIYATVGTVVTHLIGRALTGLYFERQRREADFRFSLARLREYAEQVALLQGERAETTTLLRRFAELIVNYLAIVEKRKYLTAFTTFYGQLSPIIPYILTAPFYFLGQIQLGVMTQTARAFSSVEQALTFFITYYTSLAEFKSVLDRLSSFDAAIDAADRATPPPAQESASPDIALAGLELRLPDGRRVVEADLTLRRGEATLLSGPSGSGKSTLFRALAGVWPYRDGVVSTPLGARLMLLPQRPYIPIGSLASAVTYPEQPEAFPRADIEDALRAARLGSFVHRLDEENGWSQRLSGGEQQRVAIARALLAKPDWLFLDEATAALDEELETQIYHMLAERLAQTTLVSIGHRASLRAFHARHLVMEPAGEGVYSPLEKVEA